ncbi:branched-chain amino acid transport system substrate-binding protein [Kitasatospora sp. MAP12-15]|uniref:ABC transporter substrate-binding protein n=1 Tax=unclassified Kitasatospora TaxID=2633591 RepID=UPI002472F4E6|nr:ABC transporter substrate-binding protein [Kitasatospora sp. MAP12-44]MDH6114916.1 branched-chain amino acid transport system substrate-binding protein [Kitasatospora sp. MAP12-44]
MTPASSASERRAPVRGARATGLLLLAGVLCLSGCSGGGTDAAAGQGPVRIGLLASLSGTYQEVGTDLRDGFQLYLDNHGGKLGGRTVDLVVADEGDGAPTALPAATKLVKQDKILAMTGIVGAGSVAAVTPLLTESGIPLISSNGRPVIKDVSHQWSTSFMSDDPGAAIAQYVHDTVPGPVFAIGPDYQGGWDELQGFTDAFTKDGGQLANPGGKTLFTPFPATTDFTPYFTQIKNSHAKAVYCFYAGGAAVDFVKQYAQSDVKDVPLYAAGFLTEGGVLNAQGDAAKGIQSVLNYAPDLDNATNRAFVAAWQAKHSGPPTTYAMASYDAAGVLDKAIAAAGRNLTSETLNSAIAGLGQIDSPRGTWEFGKETHSPVQKWYLRQVENDGRTLSNLTVQDLATIGS